MALRADPSWAAAVNAWGVSCADAAASLRAGFDSLPPDEIARLDAMLDRACHVRALDVPRPGRPFARWWRSVMPRRVPPARRR